MFVNFPLSEDGLKESPSPKKLPMPVGKPIITHVTQDSVTLVWYPGENQSPEYAVEMYSYETHVFAWHTVGDRAVSPKLMIGQLAAHEDYEFLVRGVNNLGFGLPSPVSSRIRTVGKLEKSCYGCYFKIKLLSILLSFSF